ncbi:metal ABC transporter substrate-binding protein [Demequina lutea]|uniref:Zinc transport system substrate-binding protein n=1 Tax=Demequina lutea TaxID=431489 RepID=A0A7Z0CHQ6_9MICO|nr:metal ABC transporter substrate-binding protein [Demequina lutea]NYI41084.1 zinc transport system substrate-binding protein [Demequina lutea]
MNKSATRLLAASAALTLLATGCSSTASSSTAPSAGTGGLTIDAAFYPLQFVAERVAGKYGTVTTLTAPGIEPHDLELSPATVRSMQSTDVVLYVGGLQPAVEDAIKATGVPSFDAADAVPLVARQTGDLSFDPHFWLDPALVAEYALAVGDQFAQLDPTHADAYKNNAADLSKQLDALDADFKTGLATCKRHDIITTHEAFGYLADAYGLHQEGLAGIDPEAEPSPARLREIKDLIAQTGATTIFTETLVSSRVADALASDAGVTTTVLNPIESVAEGTDYFSVMDQNLAALRTALDCS